MSLSLLTEYKVVGGTPIAMQSPILRATLNRIAKSSHETEEENERVLDLYDLFNEMYTTLKEADKYMDSNNNPTGKTKKRKARKT